MDGISKDENHISGLEEYDVSRAQLRIYTAQQLLNDSDDTYRINFTVRTEGSFDEERCKSVLEKLFIRHESLRTSFIMKEDGRLVQKVSPADKESAKKAVLSSKTVDFKGRMDLSRQPLFSWIYDRKAISFNFHHIISDGQSAALFAHEFATLYGGGQLKELSIHQKEAAYRERQMLSSEKYKRLRKSWKELSSGYGETEDKIVCDGVFSKKEGGSAGHVNLIIPEDTTQKADEVCRLGKVTPYVLLLSVYALLMHKYTGSEKIICGSVSSGRESTDIEDIQGMFVNTLPLFLTMSDKKTFRENMMHISERVLAMLDGQSVSLEDIANDLEDEGWSIRTAHGHLLFDHMFVMQSLEYSLPDIEGRSTYVEYGKQEKAMYDLSLEVEKKDRSYHCDFEYDKNLFSEESIRVMARHFENLLINCLKLMDESPDKIMMTDSKEIALMTGKAVIKAPEKTVVDALWQCVKKDPEKTALIFGESSLSYRDLWELSGILAKKIIDLTGDKEGPQKRAAIYAKRGFSMIISIWAVLRAGYAYVPISPSYPAERIDTILKDCDPVCVICCSISLPDMTADRLKKEKHVIIDFDIKDKRERDVDPELENPSGDKAAYMIYTSGTTGLPKGVIIEHRQLMSMLDSYAGLYGLTEDDRVLQFADYVFDQSVWDIFQILTLGGTLCLIPEDTVRDPDALTAYCSQNRVTAASLTPGLLRLLNPEKFRDLRVLDVGGEAPDRELLIAWSKGRDVYNTYGPTENTVNTTSFKFSDRGRISGDLIEKKENLPIGRPVGGSRVYILRGDELCAIGVKGELCIAGDQLARGYHKRDDLNNEKFTPDPLRPGRIYRSGDLARYLPDGNIEFLGRLDDQVKIRGYRIELGECESAIRSIKGIKDAVVTARKNNKGHYEMCGYYTAEIPGSIGAIQIRQALESSLPSYMIPEFLTELSEIPLTINGKVDKKALPEAERISYKDDIGAKSREEKDLVSAFLKVLNLEDISINDDLLILGGDSIDAIRIASILRKKGYEIDGNTILRYRTVKKIAARMKRKDDRVYEEYGEIIKTPVMRIYESSNTGAGEWFNQSVMLLLKKDINIRDLEDALNDLISIHGSLRMILKDGKLKVRGTGETEKIKIPVYSGLSGDEREDECSRLHREISLDKGDVIKAALFENEDMKRLFIAIDHYCVDEVSWSMLIGDLDRLLRKEGREEIKKDCTVSFGEWSEKLWDYRESEDFLPEKAYWEDIHERLKANRESNRNWLDAYKNPGPYKKGYSCLDESISEKTRKVLFKAAAGRYHCRADVLLLSALITAVNEEGKGNLPVFMMEGHGRGNIGGNIRSDHTAGWFTTVYPVLFERPERDDLIIDIKETLARVPNFGLGYGLLYDEEEDRKGIIFNYLGENRSEAFDMLSLTDESSGVQAGPSKGDPYTITFDIRSIREGLSIEVRYDNAFSKDMVKSLLGAFVQKLEDTAAALDPAERVYSPSDLTLGCEMDERDWELISSVYDLEKTEALSCLTALQQGMLYHYLSDPDSRAYHLLDELTVYGSIKKDELITALDILAIRYDALRIRFFNEGTHKPWQIILKEDRPCFTDCSDRYSDEVLKEAYGRRFQPGKESLLRVYLCRSRKEKDASALIISMHHIITDGWSFNILIRDLMGYYRALCDGRSKEDLREKALRDTKEGCSFADYLREYNERNVLRDSRHWEDHLQGIESQDELPLKLQSGNKNYRNKCISRKLSPDLSRSIKELTVRNHVTGSSFFCVLTGLLLGFESDTDDVIFGEIVSGRDQDIRGIEDAAGMFINTLPVRVRAEGDSSVISLIRKRQEDHLAMLPYERVSLGEIKGPTGHISDLIHCIYAYENYPAMEDEGFYRLERSREEIEYDLSFVVEEREGDGSFELSLLFNESSFDSDYMGLLLKRAENLALQTVSNEELLVKDLERICPDEKDKTPGRDIPDTEAGYDAVFTDMLYERVKEDPGRTALIMGDEYISYGALWDLAMGLSQKAGYGGERFIAIVAERSFELVIAMIAAMMSGAAYVAIDPTHPLDRIRFMLEDSKPSCIFYHVIKERDDLKGLFEEMRIPLIKCSLSEKKGEYELKAPVYGRELTDRTAYMIYTSGTSGRPKGVLIEHRSLSYLIRSHEPVFGSLRDDNVLLLANAVFDASVQQIFPALAQGGRVSIITPQQLGSAESIAAYCREKRVTFIGATNALLRSLDPESFEGIRVLSIGGDEADLELFERWESRCELLINDYGPTEATVHALYHRYQKGEKGPIPIGIPYKGKKVYIMQGDKLCARGQKGEICIGGQGLARGYHNLDDMTAKAFIKNPAGEGRLYRSGDLGYLNCDDEIIYAGRGDMQVKIRGFRIELSEIENTLRQCKGVSDAVVISRSQKGRDAYLTGYITGDPLIDTEELKEELSLKLPSYMIPSRISLLDRFPLNPSGKIDTGALPEAGTGSRKISEAPKDPFEERTAGLFERILGVKKAGRDDSFFELGGSSLELMRLLSGLNEENLRMADIVKDPTVKGIALCIRKLYLDKIKEERGSLKNSRDEGYMILKEGRKDLPAVFCIPPSGGMSVCYIKIIKEAGIRGRVYGLTDSKYEKLGKMTFEELNAYDPASKDLWPQTLEGYMDILLKFFKDGDILMGYSQGGCACHILAGLLEDKGYKVGEIIMLEAWPFVQTGEDSLKSRLISSEAAFFAEREEEKSIADNVDLLGYFAENLKKHGLGEEESLIHAFYETYLVYSANVLFPLLPGRPLRAPIYSILLKDEKKKEEGMKEGAETDPWAGYSLSPGQTRLIMSETDDHFIFLSKYESRIRELIRRWIGR